MYCKQMQKRKRVSRPRVIINADDFGITKGVNKAVSQLAYAGILTSTSVMTTMAHYEDISDLKDKIGIGIHFNLTVERPVTEPLRIPTLVNSEGKFFALSQLLKLMKRRAVSGEEVARELNAQIQRLINLGIQPDHIDSHESLLKYPFFMKIIREVAKKYAIPAVRTYSPRKFDYSRLFSPRKIVISFYLAFQKARWKMDGFRVADRYDSLITPGLGFEGALAKLKNIFQELPCGTLEVGIHPGYCNGDNGPLGEYVCEREAELQALLSEEFYDTMMNSGAELVRFKDI